MDGGSVVVSTAAVSSYRHSVKGREARGECLAVRGESSLQSAAVASSVTALFLSRMLTVFCFAPS